MSEAFIPLTIFLNLFQFFYFYFLMEVNLLLSQIHFSI